MSHELSRRQVLKLVGYASAGTAAVGSVPLLSRFFADKANAQTAPFVRENIYTFMQSPTKVAALRRGVQVMKSRSATNPTSWAYQANMHGTSNRPLMTAWNTCDHGTFFFFPWHRMYLYYFERILRQASGDRTLALPYWNYSDAPAQRVLPMPFRTPANTTNSLYESDRTGNVDVNSGNPLPATTVSYAAAFRRINFFHTTTGSSFGGRLVSQTSHSSNGKGELERRPHDQVHGNIGGLMGNPQSAALDPIFWLHHANIDRLWERWLRQGGGRANPTDNNDWMNDIFTFYDENSQQVRLSGQDVLDTATQLNYIYDDPLTRSSSSIALSSPNTDVSNQRTTASTPQELRVAGGNREITFILNDTPLTLAAPSQNLLARKVSVENSIITLNVTGVQYDLENPISYDIYINLPQGVAPNHNSPYYAGVLSLFSLPQEGTFSLDITDVVSDLQKRNLLVGGSISITFVPPSRKKPRNRKRQVRPNQLQQAVRFSGVTITRESL